MGIWGDGEIVNEKWEVEGLGEMGRRGDKGRWRGESGREGWIEVYKKAR